MITRDLEKIVLVDPFQNGCDQLKVVSGYVSATMVNRHLHRSKQLARTLPGVNPPVVDAVYGMAKRSGVAESDHNAFVRMQTETYQGRFSCSYLVDPPAVHAKIYVWLKDGKPQIAFMGSANYTQSGFVFEAERMEVIDECDPQIGLDIFQECYRRSVECSHSSVQEEITLVRDERLLVPAGDSVRLPFLIESGPKKGKTPRTAGINWAFRQNDTPRNFYEAYLRVPSRIGKTDFFPETGIHFTIITDDDQLMICVVAQDGRKGIETPESNAILGRYFRNRMDIAERRRVEAEDFEAYGRDDVTITRIDEETYYMDFGVRD